MGQLVSVSEELLVASARPKNDGYTWTLASRLGHMLRRAKELYGPRDASYTVLGIEFCGNVPQLWYPNNCRHVVIQLTTDCMTNPVKALYQLAHECIHLLAPSGGQHTNVLEDGLATHFAECYTREELGVSIPCELESYVKACALVERLLEIDPLSVRTLRKTQPAMYLLTAEDIVHVYQEIPRDLAEQLVKPFVRNASSGCRA